MEEADTNSADVASGHALIVARNLKADLDILDSALKSMQESVDELKSRFPGERLQIPVSEQLSLWVHYRFAGNWNAFVAFATESLKAWDSDKSQMWVWGGPAVDNPEPEAVRHSHRIKMATEFLARSLGVAAPSDSESHWHPRRFVARLQTYVLAATDILAPPSPPQSPGDLA